MYCDTGSLSCCWFCYITLLPEIYLSSNWIQFATCMLKMESLKSNKKTKKHTERNFMLQRCHLRTLERFPSMTPMGFTHTRVQHGCPQWNNIKVGFKSYPTFCLWIIRQWWLENCPNICAMSVHRPPPILPNDRKWYKWSLTRAFIIMLPLQWITRLFPVHACW